MYAEVCSIQSVLEKKKNVIKTKMKHITNSFLLYKIQDPQNQKHISIVCTLKLYKKLVL